MNAPAPGEAVPCQWRKRPAVLWGLPWTGANADEVRRFAVSPEGTECTRYQGEGTGLEVWNDQERCWIPCPVGHVVMKGVLGEFYPVSEAGIKGGYDPASGPGTPGQADEIPEAFGRHIRSQFPADYVLPENEITGRWKHMTGPRERKFWFSLDEQNAVATTAFVQIAATSLADAKRELREVRQVLTEVLAAISAGEFVAVASAHLNKLSRWHKSGGIEQP